MFWVITLEASVHDWWTQLLWAYDENAHKTNTSEQHQAKNKAFSSWAFMVHPGLVNITVMNRNEEPS